MVHDLATGKTFSLEHLATTVLLDRAGRLWIGADNGEFGGHVSRIDLRWGLSPRSSQRRRMNLARKPPGRVSTD